MQGGDGVPARPDAGPRRLTPHHPELHQSSSPSAPGGSPSSRLWVRTSWVPAIRYRRCSSTYPRPGSTSRAARTVVSTSCAVARKSASSAAAWAGPSATDGSAPGNCTRSRGLSATSPAASCANQAPRARSAAAVQAGLLLPARPPRAAAPGRAASGADALRLLEQAAEGGRRIGGLEDGPAHDQVGRAGRRRLGRRGHADLVAPVVRAAADAGHDDPARPARPEPGPGPPPAASRPRRRARRRWPPRSAAPPPPRGRPRRGPPPARSRPGRATSAPSRPRAPGARRPPPAAASIMAAPPSVWTVAIATPSARAAVTASATVFGMSCHLRSRNTRSPRSVSTRTRSGPSRVMRIDPTFTHRASGSRSSSRSASEPAGRSSATITSAISTLQISDDPLGQPGVGQRRGADPDQ